MEGAKEKTWVHKVEKEGNEGGGKSPHKQKISHNLKASVWKSEISLQNYEGFPWLRDGQLSSLQ